MSNSSAEFSSAESDAERASAVVQHIANVLSDHANVEQAVRNLAAQTRFADIFKWTGISLPYGDAGLAVMFAAVAEVAGPKQSRQAIASLLASGGRELAASGAPMYLFGGLPGYAAAVELAAGAGDFPTLRRQLRDRILPQMNAYLDAPTPAGGDAYDLISGLTGWVSYLSLNREDPRAQACEARVVARLAALIEPEVGFDGMIVKPVLPEQEEIAPFGYVDCGTAHGAAGVLAALAVHALDGGASTTASARSASGRGRTLQALRDGADWLVKQAIVEPEGICWPRVLLLDESGKPAQPGTTNSRSTWCYGTPGISRALWLAARALDDPALGTFAADAMRSVLDPKQLKALPTPTLCHGLSGALMAALHFAWDGAGTDFSSAADHIASLILDRYEPEVLLGFRDVEVGGGPVDNVGLLSGAAGVAAALAAWIADRPPTWSRLLLLN